MDPEKQQQCKRIIVAVSRLDAEGEVMLNISSQSLAKLLNSSPTHSAPDSHSPDEKEDSEKEFSHSDTGDETRVTDP